MQHADSADYLHFRWDSQETGTHFLDLFYADILLSLCKTKQLLQVRGYIHAHQTYMCVFLVCIYVDLCICYFKIIYLEIIYKNKSNCIHAIITALIIIIIKLQQEVLILIIHN